MFGTTNSPKAFTPEEVASMLQLSKNTVYELISRGEIVAKKFGKMYRVPASSLSFMFTGLDLDLYNAEQIDMSKIESVSKNIQAVRKANK